MARSAPLGCALLSLLLVASCSWASAAEADVDESDVVVLTVKNFEVELRKQKYALVEFYAPWCGHCKSLKPAYAAAATEVKKLGLPVVLAKVDATVEADLGSQFEVRGYPTLKWFVDGKVASDFGGGRTKDDIVHWVSKKSGPATTDLESVAALETATEKPGVVALAYFSKLSGPDFESYVELAESKDDTEFFTTTSKDVAAKLGLTAPGSLAVSRSYEGFETESVTSTGNPAFEGVGGAFSERAAAFLLAERLPAYLEFNQQNAAAIFGSGISKQIILAAPAASFAPGAELDTLLRAVSAKSRGSVVLVVAKLGEDSAKPILDFFGLDAAKVEPQPVGFESTSSKKYSFPEGAAVDVDGLVAFAQSLADGTAEVLRKSAPVPEEPKENGVTVVVGSTVDSIVNSEEHDVLLEVYAPWCGHCKSLAPTYEKLAQRFASVDSVVIAKLDGTTNEHPSIEAKGYPTLLFFPAGTDKTPVPYTGDRTVPAFTKFLKKHANKTFTLPKKGKGKKVESEEPEIDHGEL